MQVIEHLLGQEAGLSGKEGGRTLGAFIISKKDDFAPIRQMGGPLTFLFKNLKHFKALDVPGTTSTEVEVLKAAMDFVSEFDEALSARSARTGHGAAARAPLFGEDCARPPARAPLFAAAAEEGEEDEGGEEVGTGPTVARPRARPMARSARPVSSTSATCTNLLPTRQGTSTPASRGAVRTSAMRILRVDGGAAGLNQARGDTAEVRLLDVLRSDRPARDRSGRILGATRGRIFDQPGQLEPGLLRVQAKLRTSVLRSDFHSDSSVVVDDDVSDDEEGAGRGARVVREYMVTDDNLPDGDWQRLMPVEGKKLVGHLVCSLYHNQEGRPEWYDAVVIEHMVRKYNRGTSDMYRLYFEEDGFDDWYSLPDSHVIFSDCKVSKSVLAAAQAACRD